MTSGVWRMHWVARWFWSGVLLVVAGIAVAYVLQPHGLPLAGSIILSGVVLLLIGFWTWIILWRPRAIIGSDDLLIVNRFLRHRLRFDERFRLIRGTTFVTFEGGGGQRVTVSAMPVRYFLRSVLPWSHLHSERFMSAVEARLAQENL